MLPRRWAVERTIAWLNRCRTEARSIRNLRTVATLTGSFSRIMAPMKRFQTWQALLAFGLLACPVPLLGQVCVVAALIWRAYLASISRSPLATTRVERRSRPRVLRLSRRIAAERVCDGVEQFGLQQPDACMIPEHVRVANVGMQNVH